jgi:hypothetical protein
MCDFGYEGRDRVFELGQSPLKQLTCVLDRCAADDWGRNFALLRCCPRVEELAAENLSPGVRIVGAMKALPNVQ